MKENKPFVMGPSQQACVELTESLKALLEELRKNQVELSKEESAILYSNLWELYGVAKK